MDWLKSSEHTHDMKSCWLSEVLVVVTNFVSLHTIQFIVICSWVFSSFVVFVSTIASSQLSITEQQTLLFSAVAIISFRIRQMHTRRSRRLVFEYIFGARVVVKLDWAISWVIQLSGLWLSMWCLVSSRFSSFMAAKSSAVGILLVRLWNRAYWSYHTSA